MKLICYAILIVMTIMGSFASLFLKKASSSQSVKAMILNVNIYLGGGLYFLSALLNIYVLKYLDYTIVLPLTSITYIWTLILSYVVLKEKISVKKMLCVFGIIVGAALVAM
ncbi:MAG: EamA family transporter [Hyphomonadaceae bacterium]|nr:EamA family transporter [Clostridia bacterium]